MSSKRLKEYEKVNTEYENQTCDKNLCVDLQTRKRRKLSILLDLALGFVSEFYSTCYLLSYVRLSRIVIPQYLKFRWMFFWI
jgi:hypothetical protein